MSERPPSDDRRLSPPDRFERRVVSLAAVLLALLAIQGLIFIGESSQTNDEAARILGGYAYLTRGDFRLDIVQPPLLKELAVLPLLWLHLQFPSADSVPAVPGQAHAGAYRLGELFVQRNTIPGDTILFLARLPTLALSLLLGALIFVFTRRLFGAAGGLLALALYVFDPNVVAHSGLATTDLGAALFFFLTMLAFRAWMMRPSRLSLIGFGLALGGALASKYSALWLLPILGLAGLVFALGRAIPARRLAAGALVAGAIAVAVIVAAYGVSGAPSYLSGLNYGVRKSEAGYTAYLMGASSPDGWWYYFLLSYLMKTPPGTLLIVAASIVAALLGRRRDWREESLLWLPIALIVLITCFWRVNIGLRHLLPLYPFLYASAGRLAWRPPVGAGSGRVWAPSGRWRGATPVLLCAAVGWNALEAAAISPDDLAYFNRFVGGPAKGHLYLLDSNLDWGQASKALRRFMTREGVPEIYCSFAGNSDPWYAGIRYQYVPGVGNFEDSAKRGVRVADGLPRELLAVSAMSLHFAGAGGEKLYDWLADRPVVAMPGYAYMVYDIGGDAEAHGRLAAFYLASGLADMAGFEARRALRLDPGNARGRAVLQRLEQHYGNGG